MAEYTIRDLQNAGYYLLCKLQDICEELDIKAVLGFGTLLGAIRHNGFIPWDDDIDVLMSYKDFKKLEKHFKKTDWWIGDVFLDTVRTDHEIKHCLPRLRLDNSYVNELEDDGINMNNGLWLDIFVFCDAAGSPFLRKLQLFLRSKVFLLHEKYLNRQKRRNGDNIISTRVIYRLAERLPDGMRIRLINSLLKLICALGSRKNTDMLNLCMFTRNYFYPKHFIADTDKHIFETRVFDIPKDFNACLSYSYGKDYMTPLKENPHFRAEAISLPSIEKLLQ